MSRSKRWAGAAPTAAPTATHEMTSHQEGRRQRNPSSPCRGQTPPGGQRELTFDDDRRLSTADRFEAFHRRNPLVYRTLVALAREWVRRTGKRRLGIATLYERCRWDLAIVTDGRDYRLNNDHKSFYARLIMAQEPDLAGLFEVRQSVADETPARVQP